MARSVIDADLTPTADMLRHYQLLYDYFNQRLFDGELPHCLLSFATHGRSKGFFTASRWHAAEEGREEGRGLERSLEPYRTAHEISLNPLLLDEPMEDIMGWLVRFMVQLWQWEHGKYRSRIQGYYPRELTLKAEGIGLLMTDDGTPEGNRSGFKMRHKIAEDGALWQAIREMPVEPFPWKPGKKEKPPKATTFKYQCPSCGVKITAPREIIATCNTMGCNRRFELMGA